MIYNNDLSDAAQESDDILLLWIRHGESTFNANSLLRDRDVPLTEKGREQADRLKKELNLDLFDVVICSPLRRAQETAKIIFDRADVILSHLCREYIADECDLMVDEDSFREDSDQLEKRQCDFLDGVARLCTENGNKRIAIVSHADFIHAFTGAWLDNACAFYSVIKQQYKQ